MKDFIKELKETCFIDVWDNKSGNDRAPYVKLVITDKQTKERMIYPVWRNREGKLYVADGETAEQPQKPAYNKVTKDVAGIDDDFGDSVPFTWIAALVVPALTMLGV